MRTRYIWATALAGTVTAAYLAHRPAPQEAAHEPRLGAIQTTHYLDVSGSNAVYLPAIERWITAREGTPSAYRGNSPVNGTWPDGGFVPSAFDTTAKVSPVPHPTDPTRWYLALDSKDTVWYALLKVYCLAAVDAGTASAGCSVVASLPALVTTLDPSWKPDGGYPYWWSDAGVTMYVPSIADPLDGGQMPISSEDGGDDSGDDASP
jgi:hypothetical protein